MALGLLSAVAFAEGTLEAVAETVIADTSSHQGQVRDRGS